MSGYEVIVTFAEGGGCAVARCDAETFEEAAGQMATRLNGRNVKTLEITDLSFEDTEAAA